MSVDLNTIYDKVVAIDKRLEVFHAENKSDIKTLFRMKDTVDGLKCETHAEKLLWITSSVRILWGVLIVGGVVSLGVKLYLGI